MPYGNEAYSALPERFKDFISYVRDEANQDEVVGFISNYAAGGGYTGAHFHELTWTGDKDENRIDIAEVASLSLLSVTLTAHCAKELQTGPLASQLERHFATHPDQDLADLSDADFEALGSENGEGLTPAWRLIKGIHGMGPTRTSKLLARKRPRLIPIWDSVVERTLGYANSKTYWRDSHTALVHDDRGLDKRLKELSALAGVEDRYSRLRVLDIIIWQYGQTKKGLTPEILTEKGDEPTAE